MALYSLVCTLESGFCNWNVYSAGWCLADVHADDSDYVIRTLVKRTPKTFTIYKDFPILEGGEQRLEVKMTNFLSKEWLHGAIIAYVAANKGSNTHIVKLYDEDDGEVKGEIAPGKGRKS